MNFLAKYKDNTIYLILQEMRVRQWIKNMFVFAAPFFAKELLHTNILIKSILAFLVLCSVSSFVYIMNDLADVESDKKHPVKKFRPVASNRLVKSLALKVSVILLFFGLVAAYFINTNGFLFYTIFLYIILQVLYTFWLKHEIIIDALVVSIGFILRVFAGIAATSIQISSNITDNTENFGISSWVILTVIGLSLLLAFGKRKAEKVTLIELDPKFTTRKTLKNYPDSLLDSMITMSATYTIISYSFFAFFNSPRNITPGIVRKYLPYALHNPKWMMFTIPVVIYAIARYLYIIYESKSAENPEKVIFSDKPFLYSIWIWILMSFFFYYILGNVDF